MNDTIKTVCHLLGVAPADLLSKSKEAELVEARDIIALLLYNHHGWTDQAIADALAPAVTRSGITYGRQRAAWRVDFEAGFRTRYKLVERVILSHDETTNNHTP